MFKLVHSNMPNATRNAKHIMDTIKQPNFKFLRPHYSCYYGNVRVTYVILAKQQTFSQVFFQTVDTKRGITGCLCPRQTKIAMCNLLEPSSWLPATSGFSSLFVSEVKFLCSQAILCPVSTVFRELRGNANR